MLKVILVDDEEISRNKLKRIITSQKLAVEIIGMAEDGEEALELINEDVPDLVITDIRMPFLDGLELMTKVKCTYPYVYFIFISGHDEFKYAHKAIKLGAYDYILKPINGEYLAEKINSIIIERKMDNQQKERITESSMILRKQFINDLLYNKISDEKIIDKLKDLEISMNRFCIAIVIQMDDYYSVMHDLDKNQQRTLLGSFYDLSKEFAGDGYLLHKFTGDLGELIICISAIDNHILKTVKQNILIGLREQADLENRYTVTAGIGLIQPSLATLSDSFSQAMESLNYKFIIGENKDIYFERLTGADIKQNRSKEFDFDMENLTTQIGLCNKNEVSSAIKVLLEKVIKNQVFSIHHVQMIITDIYLSSIRTLASSGGTINEVFTNAVDVYENMMEKETAEKLIIEVNSVLSRIMDYILLKRDGKYDHIIVRAKSFISKNFNRSDLSLNEVASASNMSSCYFAVIFKQEVGKTFIEYLTLIRIEKAKELLTISGMRSYEISYKIGYENPTYFSSIFKRTTGLTPTEYRKNVLNK